VKDVEQQRKQLEKSSKSERRAQKSKKRTSKSSKTLARTSKSSKKGKAPERYKRGQKRVISTSSTRTEMKEEITFLSPDGHCKER